MADKQYTNVLQVPDSALYGENTVYVIEDGRMALRKIRIHGFAGANILFSSDGDPPIMDGDLVMTTQLREGGQGAKVNVR